VANTNAPYGFRYVGLIDGTPPNYGLYTGKIITTNTNKIFAGDVLKPLSGGYFDVATVVGGGSQVGAIAVGFEWISKTIGRRVFQPYWPGNGDANGDVTVKVALQPQSMFQVQCTLGPIAQANVGQNANFNVGAGGNTFSGISSFTLDDSTLGAGASLPFRVYRIGTTDPLYTMSGFDPTVAYNSVFVVFNNQVMV
jgi:hypothetical protein